MSQEVVFHEAAGEYSCYLPNEAVSYFGEFPIPGKDGTSKYKKSWIVDKSIIESSFALRS